MLEILIAAFATGILSKFVDMVEEHNLKLPVISSRISGIIYGSLIAYVISVSPELSGLWIATVIAVLVTGKIDTEGHYLGLGSMLFFAAILGIAQINVFNLVLFSFIAITDELVNDRITDKGKISNKSLSSFIGLRPLLEIAAFVIALVSGQWIIWLGLFSYDAGYALIEHFGKIKS